MGKLMEEAVMVMRIERDTQSTDLEVKAGAGKDWKRVLYAEDCISKRERRGNQEQQQVIS